ncbi:MAG: hypothetical protein ACYCWW_18365 [Deltaproteobacteria bacterium]
MRGPRIGRERSVRLTEAGEELARHATGAAHQAERAFLLPLGNARGVLWRLLRVLLSPPWPKRAERRPAAD